MQPLKINTKFEKHLFIYICRIHPLRYSYNSIYLFLKLINLIKNVHFEDALI